MHVFHVAKSGNDSSVGTADSPFFTISKAAMIAEPGDVVIVHEGTYREWVSPERGGTNEFTRITYKAADGEHVTIKGSEVITDWKQLEGAVWYKEVSNSFFGNFNPFVEKLYGDWLIWPLDYDVHTGDVFLNGRSMYEATSLEDVKHPSVRRIGEGPGWSSKKELIPDSDFTVYVWYAETDSEKTTIYANFQNIDPNENLTEISVRPVCFFPRRTGVNYITVDGFEIAQAATQWAPPTAFQQGLIGPHWSKSWIIENCDIHDSKASGISLGKEISTGDNEARKYARKPGYQYQFEVVCKALGIGWNSERIGSHIIRNNTIHDCGQNGIVGHLGCIFSQIYHNEIYRIGTKHEFFGYEIAGIKLHAAIDAEIRNNYIHDCTLGTWLDWETQGTRVSANIYQNNDRDIFIEVSHGPFIVDNNIFASEYAFDNVSQGGAYINNIFAGSMRREAVLDRSTPYHFAHSTQIAGTAFVYSGDDRWYNNIFIGRDEVYNGNASCGTVGYNGSPSTLAEYLCLTSNDLTKDHDKYFSIKQPVYIRSNLYLNGAKPYEKEIGYAEDDMDPKFCLTYENGSVCMEITMPDTLPDCRIIDSATLTPPRITECGYEDRYGQNILFEKDIVGSTRTETSAIGPVVGLEYGRNKVKVWEKTK